MENIRSLMEGFKRVLTEEVEEEARVTLLNTIEQSTAEEWEIEPGVYQELLEHIGEVGIATLVVQNDNWDRNYYDLEFPDGFIAYEILGSFMQPAQDDKKDYVHPDIL